MNNKGKVMESKKNIAAFTLMEIIVVIVIVGVISSFAITNYSKSMETSYEQDATMQLRTIHSANQIYKARTGAYWPSEDNQNLAAINNNVTGLGLNIIANEQTYECDTDIASGFRCTATRSGGSGRVVTVTGAALSAGNPVCTSNCS
jgi:prepilin-type N-terminal cleavage/methylation domain-containing protein